MRFLVDKSVLAGEISITTSKSHTMRAILLASMAEGKSRVRHPLHSPDAEAMLKACRALGAQIAEQGAELEIIGTGANLRIPSDVINVGNSGQVLRFGAAMAARLPHYTVFTGDASVRTLRPMQPMLDALNGLGHSPSPARATARLPS